MNPHVVIVGGGFGGLYAAKALAKQKYRVTLIDRRNFHLFQPLLYQVATAGLSPGNIAVPLRAVFRRYPTVNVLMGEVQDLDVKSSAIVLTDGSRMTFDYLILATGASHSYFGNERWAPHAPGLKSIENALEIRRRVLLAYEIAERTEEAATRAEWLTFVVVGGGPTGLELAGALAEMAHLTMRGNFRSIDPATATILLIEAGERVLSSFPPELSSKAMLSLARLGVTVRTKTTVVDVTDRMVTVRQGENTMSIPTRTVIWAAGVQASPLGKVIETQTGAALDRAGRVVVEPDLSVPGFPKLFVIGDLAHFEHGLERPLPGVAPVAMQQGRYVAGAIVQREAGSTPEQFRYFDKGTMATIGRAAAVAEIGKLKLSGYLAWLSWLFIHLLYLAEFDNRILVFLQWVWNYLTYRRGVRLIVNEDPRFSESKLQ